MSAHKNIVSLPLITVLRNVLVAFFCLTVCRVVFLVANWGYYAEYMDIKTLLTIMVAGLRFDASAIGYLGGIYFLLVLFPCHIKENKTFHKIVRWAFIVPVMCGLALNLADTVYFRFSGARTTKAVFMEFGNDGNIAQIILEESLHSWYLVVVGILLLFILIKWVKIPYAKVYNGKWSYYTLHTLSFILILFLTVCGIRGSFRFSKDVRPMTMNYANQYVNRADQAIAILNSPFCFMRTLAEVSVPNPRYFDEDELDAIYTPVIQPDSASAFRQKNVVVFILESFSTEYFGAYNTCKQGYVSYTPFLDSLVNAGCSFTQNFANGRKSIDAIPSVLCGIPYINEHFVTSTYAMNRVNGLGSILGGLGYMTAFFHGAPNSSMGFQAIARSCGFTEYYGMDDFLADNLYGGYDAYDGTWGIWDEEFLQYAADQMNALGEPFAGTVFTVSSHHPFNIPERYKSDFPEGEVPLQKCIRYSDHALKLFFEKASAMPWFKNTLFVFTGDHTNQSWQSEYKTDRGLFNVPVFFYDPSGELQGHNNSIAQQIDILPTVLAYLGYSEPIVAFGQNLLSTPADQKYAVTYHGGFSYLYKDGYMLQFDGENAIAFYDYQSDNLLLNNLKGTMPGKETSYEQLLKAILQQYVSRMLSDRLTATP